MAFHAVLKSVHGRSLGLDAFDNLVIGGSKIYWGQTGPVQGVFDLTVGSQGGLTFAQSVAATPGASHDNYAPTGYAPGVTNRLLLLAAAGGTTLNGLGAVPTDGFAILVSNTSTTDGITFTHLAGSSSVVNQFSCPNGVNAFLAPLSNVLLVYVTNVWTLL